MTASSAKRIKYLDQVIQLSEGLPVDFPSGETATQELRARAMLGYIVRWALLFDAQKVDGPRCDPLACPNCLKAFSSDRTPYCCPQCRDEAAFVRHFRAGVVGDLSDNEERQCMLGQLVWTLLGGGYPLRQNLVLARNRDTVMARHGGRCELCERPATSVEHIRTGCNRPINLRPVCSSCARTKPFGDLELLESDRVQAHLDRLCPRLASEQALRVCDDPLEWNWREFLRNRHSRPAGPG